MTKKNPAPVLHVHNGIEVVTYVKGRMLAERKLGPIVLKLSSTSERFDLVDQSASKEADWHLFVGDVNEGRFSVSTHQETGNWSISSSRIDSLRGVGIGKWVYMALVEYYGILESDPYGRTSADATRVWKKLGAEMLPTAPGREARYRLLSKKEKEKAKKAKKKEKL